MTSYDTVVAADSPVAWWKLSDNIGSSTAADSSGNSHTLTTVTAVTFGQTGLPAGMPADTGAAFASGSSSTITGTSWDGPTSSPFSVEIWLNPNGLSNGNFAAFIGQGNAPSTSHGWLLQNDFGDLQFSVGNGSTVTSIQSASFLGGSSWIYLAATYDGTTLKQYINATASGTGTLTGPMVPQTGAGIAIGSVNAGNFFNGLMAQAAVYSGVALTSTQVTNHYNAGITTPSNPPVTVSPGSLSVVQTTSGTVAVSLSSAPGSNTTVTTAFTSGNTGVTITSGASLTFTPANYATPQNVTFAADPVSGGPAVFTASATGYTSATITVTELATARPVRKGLLAFFP